MQIEKEVAFFDAFAESQGEYDVLGEPAYERLLDELARLANITSESVVVDLGCGSGAFTRRVAGRFECRLVGIDISPGLIARARQHGTSEQYAVGDLLQLNLPSASVDCALYSGVLHHLTEERDRRQALSECYRVLKPGGCVFAYDPSAQSPSMCLYRHPRSPFYSSMGKTENEVLLHRRQVTYELAQAGFEKVQVRGVGGITFRYVAGPLARTLLPLYNTYEVLLKWSPLENLLGTFLVSFAVKRC